MHQFTGQQNRGNYGGKNFSNGPSPNHNGPAVPQNRASEPQEEGK